ncbi:MAG: dihydropteroate synthase [Saprospiraceae bacterium]
MNVSPFYCPETINLGGSLISLKRPIVMGVINLTEDSFYSESRILEPQQLILKVNQMKAEGASIIDLGAMSSRPGATLLPLNVEIDRLRNACDIIKDNCPDTNISIDTFRVDVLNELEPGTFHMVNDISGGQMNEEMYSWVGARQVPYVLMHMKGTPETMRSLASYEDIIKEMLDYFIERIPKLLACGVKDILVDPGFGFAKNIDHNFYLLKHMHVFQMLEFPMMVGLSRKSMIWKTLDQSPGDALNGTTALHMQALNKGAKILRVHDVKEAEETIKLWTKINA